MQKSNKVKSKKFVKQIFLLQSHLLKIFEEKERK